MEIGKIAEFEDLEKSNLLEGIEDNKKLALFLVRKKEGLDNLIGKEIQDIATKDLPRTVVETKHLNSLRDANKNSVSLRNKIMICNLVGNNLDLPGGFDAENLILYGDIVIRKSTFGHTNLKNIEMWGKLLAEDLIVEGSNIMTGAQIYGDLIMDRIQVGGSNYIDEASIDGSCSLNNSYCESTLVLNRSNINGNLELNGTKGGCTILNDTNVKGNLMFSNSKLIDIQCRGLSVGKDLHLNGTQTAFPIDLSSFAGVQGQVYSSQITDKLPEVIRHYDNLARETENHENRFRLRNLLNKIGTSFASLG